MGAGIGAFSPDHVAEGVGETAPALPDHGHGPMALEADGTR